MQQEVLDRYPDADLRVYAIWLPIFPDDARDRIPLELLRGERVVHWWDQEQRVGRWYARRLREMERTLARGSIEVGGTILWDAYLVYGPEAQWTDTQASVRRWGRPILATRDALTTALAGIVGAKNSN